MSGTRVAKITTALLLLFALAPAAAAADPIAGGRTNLRLDGSLYQRLQANGVQVEPLKPGKVAHRVVTLPVSSGLLESTYGSGYLFYRGGVRLRAGEHKVTLRHLVLNTTENWLRGTVAGRKLTVASALDRHPGRDGFNIEIALKLRLTGQAAAALNRRLGLPGLFKAGRSLAGATTVARPETVSVSGGTIQVSIDPRFNAKLDSLGVGIGTFEEATLVATGPPTFTIPVLHGSIAPDLSNGALVCQGGLVFTKDGEPPRQARFTGMSLALDSDRLSAGMSVDPPPPSGGLFGTAPLAAVDFSGATPSVDPTTGSITVSSTGATLEPYAAVPLNEAFPPPAGKPPSFGAGEPFGAVSFSVQTR